MYFNIRLAGNDTKKQCIRMLMGATADGRKGHIAVSDGYRESKDSWLEVIRDLKRRWMTVAPTLAIGDGTLGVWAAVRQERTGVAEQRCWVHETANVLTTLPRSRHGKAKAGLQEIWNPPMPKQAEAAFDAFLKDHEARYPKAVECFRKDREELLSFHRFPAEHWQHLRTTKPIESTFAAIRHRHRRTKRNGSRVACLAMVFKLAQTAQLSRRRLNGRDQLVYVIRGVQLSDGERKVAARSCRTLIHKT